MRRPESPLGPLKRRDDEPVFDEPWQAQALGLADILVTAGVISAESWSKALGTELRNRAAAGNVDDADTYYRAILAALQTLLCESGKTARDEIYAREADWRNAYLNTPHGMPVKLGASEPTGKVPHDQER